MKLKHVNKAWCKYNIMENVYAGHVSQERKSILFHHSI